MKAKFNYGSGASFNNPSAYIVKPGTKWDYGSQSCRWAVVNEDSIRQCQHQPTEGLYCAKHARRLG